MSELSIDEYSARILAVLKEKGENWTRYNILWRSLEALKWGSSKPTFNKHLKSLVEEGIVERREMGKQNIIFRIDYNSIKISKKYLDAIEKGSEKLKNQYEELFSMPINDQIKEVLSAVAIKKLLEIKSKINIGVDKNNIDDRYKLFILLNPFLARFENWMVNKGIKDKVYRKELIDELDKMTNFDS